MSGRKVIVKRLNSIQNFGAMDVLCTDKTGTLTQDKVLLKRHLDITGAESERVLEYAYLNSYHQSGLKNLLDIAVLEHEDVHASLDAAGRYRKVDEIPFDFQRRRMSVVVERDRSEHVLICKGAVEEVIAICTHVEEGGKVVDIEPGHIADLTPAIRELNEDGFRVIAVAYKEVPAGAAAFGVSDEAGLVLCGYIAFLDPPKDSAADAIRVLGGHGVRVKVLTGDNEAVTRKVCRDVGLEVGNVLLGREIEAMDDAALAGAVEGATIFAKLSPHQKVRVIQALHSCGCVVGFLGDGINDGPALKAADVGVSVDTAVDIARESADIIMLEKNLLVLDDGVIEGRKVFGNIMKYLKMGSSSNFGNMLSVVGASAFLPFLPMAPVQILTNNLLYDASQTAVATDKVDDEYVAQPRRWDIGNIGRYMLFIGPLSSLFDYATYFTLLYQFDAWQNAALFQTGWFMESLLSQTLVVHIIRTGRIPFMESRASLTLGMATLGICAVGIWLPFSPFAHALGFTPLPAAWFAALAAILAGYLALTQAVKAWLVRRFGLA
jgi:Mg2+-importing ATPase